MGVSGTSQGLGTTLDRSLTWIGGGDRLRTRARRAKEDSTSTSILSRSSLLMTRPRNSLYS
jgi:hypothetical protein